MTQILLLPLMMYAACGLALSLTANVLSFFGIQFGGKNLFFALGVGIFPMWLPVVLISMKMLNGAQRKDFWKIALSGCPTWMRYMTYGFFIYAVVNFFIFMVLVSMHSPAKGDVNPPSEIWHGFSGHWMAFYSAGLAILMTAYRRGLSNLQRRCPNGHNIGWRDQFCPTCGIRCAPEVAMQ